MMEIFCVPSSKGDLMRLQRELVALSEAKKELQTALGSRERNLNELQAAFDREQTVLRSEKGRLEAQLSTQEQAFQLRLEETVVSSRAEIDRLQIERAELQVAGERGAALTLQSHSLKLLLLLCRATATPWRGRPRISMCE